MPSRILPSRNAKIAAVANVAALLEAESQPEIEPEADDVVRVHAKVQTAVHDAVQTEVAAESEQSVVVQKSGPAIFTTFKSNKELPQGLSIIRRIGRHKFQVINLAAVNITELGTEEMGRRIGSSPGLMSALDVSQDTWCDASSKAEQALKSATGEIFRFLNLPIELRFRCYDFLVLSPKALHINYSLGDRTPFNSGLKVRLLNKQIWEESSRFFWKNNFSVPSLCKVLKSFLTGFVENVREITFRWTGHRNLDRQTFEMFASCPNLKVLTILVRHCLGSEHWTQTRQYLHLHETSITKFSRLTGFDVLASIRGLERVNVRPSSDFDILARDNDSHPTKAQIKELGVWLQKRLSLPKVDAELSATKSKKKLPKSKAKKAKSDDADFRP